MSKSFHDSFKRYVAYPSRYCYNIKLPEYVFLDDEMAKLWVLTNINVCKYVQTLEQPLPKPSVQKDRGERSAYYSKAAMIVPLLTTT